MRRDELKGLITLSGKTQADVANKLGISLKSFNHKINKSYFGSDEIDIMIDYLNIKDPMWVFFDRKVTLKDTQKISYVKQDK